MDLITKDSKTTEMFFSSLDRLILNLFLSVIFNKIFQLFTRQLHPNVQTMLGAGRLNDGTIIVNDETMGEPFIRHFMKGKSCKQAIATVGIVIF